MAKSTKLIKSCRIYTDITGQNVLLYYIAGENMPETVQGGTIKSLQDKARKLGITQYYFQYSMDLKSL